MENEQNNDNLELLNELYKNLRIATQSIENILSCIKLDDITLELSKESSQYYVFEKEATMIAKAQNYNLKDNNFIQKSQVWLSVKANLLSSSTTQHIAEMLLVGSMMGIIDLVKALTNNDRADEEIKDLVNKVLEFERNNVENLFEYLKVKPQKIENDNTKENSKDENVDGKSDCINEQETINSNDEEN